MNIHILRGLSRKAVSSSSQIYKTLNLDTMRDCKMCAERLHIDSSEYQAVMESAHTKLYNQNYAVDGNQIDGLLKDKPFGSHQSERKDT